jgi:aryl-alcohol dehydrogenase-like predicted oxidoreductase
MLKMQIKKLPNAEIKLSPITYGAFAVGGWFWGGADVDDAINAMYCAIENGVTSIDTAPVYGMGQSEELVGKVIKGRRESVQLLTKFGMRWDSTDGEFAFDTFDNDDRPLRVYKFNGKQSVIEECERSLKRLGTDYIDIYQMHWPESSTPIEETMEALELLKEQGKIRAAGVCNCPVELLERASSVTDLLTNQVAYSMVNRTIEKQLVPYCLDRGIGILSHTTLQKGLLTGKIRPGHQFAEGDHRPTTPFFAENNHKAVIDLLDALEPLAKDKHISLAQLAINWTMLQPGITSVLVGARNQQQMLDNVKALDFSLTDDELAFINKELDQVTLKLSL